uniref:CCHC-type domain-containing protein n=1 Tax=Caenorhabditis tropicalis TaxID=1561998 RepID=A0A1I7TGJ9_9PELO
MNQPNTKTPVEYYDLFRDLCQLRHTTAEDRRDQLINRKNCEYCIHTIGTKFEYHNCHKKRCSYCGENTHNKAICPYTDTIIVRRNPHNRRNKDQKRTQFQTDNQYGRDHRTDTDFKEGHRRTYKRKDEEEDRGPSKRRDH